MLPRAGVRLYSAHLLRLRAGLRRNRGEGTVVLHQLRLQEPSRRVSTVRARGAGSKERAIRPVLRVQREFLLGPMWIQA